MFTTTVASSLVCFHFPQSCGGSFSGGSAVSDSNLPRSVGPHNTLSIKDEMETANKLSEIFCSHRCAGGLYLGFILLLHEDLLETAASVTGEAEKHQLCCCSLVVVQEAVQQGSICTRSWWIVARYTGSSFLMHSPPASCQRKIYHCFENRQLEMRGTQTWPCSKEREMLWKHI